MKKKQDIKELEAKLLMFNLAIAMAQAETVDKVRTLPRKNRSGQKVDTLSEPQKLEKKRSAA